MGGSCGHPIGHAAGWQGTVPIFVSAKMGLSPSTPEMTGRMPDRPPPGIVVASCGCSAPRVWLIAIIISAVIAINYLDRQTLAVAIKAVQEDIPISDKDFGNLQAIFFFAYALMYVGGGRLVDALGTRRGFALIIIWWSLACASQGLATGVLILLVGRLMLGLAEGGTSRPRARRWPSGSPPMNGPRPWAWSTAAAPSARSSRSSD